MQAQSELFCKKWMNPYIFKTDANLAIRAIWANHCDSAKRVMLGGLDKLKDFIIS